MSNRSEQPIKRQVTLRTLQMGQRMHSNSISRNGLKCSSGNPMVSWTRPSTCWPAWKSWQAASLASKEVLEVHKATRTSFRIRRYLKHNCRLNSKSDWLELNFKSNSCARVPSTFCFTCSTIWTKKSISRKIYWPQKHCNCSSLCSISCIHRSFNHFWVLLKRHNTWMRCLEDAWQSSVGFWKMSSKNKTWDTKNWSVNRSNCWVTAMMAGLVHFHSGLAVSIS